MRREDKDELFPKPDKHHTAPFCMSSKSCFCWTISNQPSGQKGPKPLRPSPAKERDLSAPNPLLIWNFPKICVSPLTADHPLKISVETADEIPSNINIHPTTQRYPGIVRGKNALTVESVANHDMKEIFYSWINGLWTGAKILPKMSQFTRFSRVNAINLAHAKHSQNECTLRPDKIPKHIHSTMQKYPGIVRWISCWSMTLEGAPRYPKQQNEYLTSECSDLEN